MKGKIKQIEITLPLEIIKRWSPVKSPFFCRGEKSLSFFGMRHLMPSLGSSDQKMIFLLYRPNFLLFPKEEKEKSCNNLKKQMQSPKLKAMHKWGRDSG